MASDLRDALSRRLLQAGAWEVRIADPSVGFEHALEGSHPLDLWPRCRSVVVFAVAHSIRANNIFAGPLAPFDGDRGIGPIPHFLEDAEHALDRLSRLFVSSIRLKGMTLLAELGHEVSFRFPQLKLAGFEAGLGVYGRSGILIHPLLGNRMTLGAIMTDAPLSPDGRLAGFDPCRDCAECAKACPAGALDAGLDYPESWSGQKCVEKRAIIEDGNLYCNNCFAVCPACRLPDGSLLEIRTADCISKAHRFRLEISDTKP
jgi:hypothetical protein